MIEDKNKLNSQFPDVAENLEILAEECGEVIVAKSKVLRFGSQSKWNSPTNQRLLGLEVGDLMAMIQILMDNGFLRQSDVEDGIARKLEKLSKFYKVDKLTGPHGI